MDIPHALNIPIVSHLAKEQAKLDKKQVKGKLRKDDEEMKEE